MTSTHAPAPEAAKRHRRWPWFVGAVTALIVIAVLIVVGVASIGSGKEPRAEGFAPSLRDYAPVVDEPKSSTPPAPPPPSDFTIDLKTVTKQCFGSAGCNLVVEPRISYAGSIEQFSAYGICDVTYEITGDESGEVIETAYGQGGAAFAVNRTMLQTTSNAVTPSATITDVSCS